MVSRDFSDLVDDLVYLRKGSGATPARIAQASAVMDVVGGGRDASPVVVRQRLATAFGAIKANKGCDALRAAMALDDDVDTVTDLTERRARYGNHVGRSLNTVRAWETDAIQDLALTLLSRYYAGAATPLDAVMPHGGFLLERLRVTALIKDRLFVEDEQIRTVVSLVDGAKGFRYGSYSPTTLSSPTGGALLPPDVSDAGVVHKFMFDEPLRRGEMHTFGFREQVPEGSEDESTAISLPDGRVVHRDFSGQTFETPTLRYDVEVRFLGEMPEAVWSYDKLSRIERPGSLAGQPPVILDGNVARMTFRELYGGLAAGIAWVWKD